jgi:hypothetical protein
MIPKRCRRKGQSLTEFALVLPITLFVILAVAVLFHFFAVLVTTHNAASEGGRAAQVWRTDTGVTCEQYVIDAVLRTTPFFNASRGDTIGTSTNCPRNTTDRIDSGELVQVQVVVNWEPMFFATLFRGAWEPPTTIPLTAEVFVRHE